MASTWGTAIAAGVTSGSGYSEPGRPVVRLSDGTLIAAYGDNTSKDVFFEYSTDGGYTWTLCSTAWTGTWTGGITSWVDADDNIWVTAKDGSSYPYVSGWTFSGTDVAALMTEVDIKHSATAHYAGDLIVFEDPGDSGQYMIMASFYITTPLAFVQMMTVDKDGTNPSAVTTLTSSTANATTPPPLLCMKWTGDESTPEATGPDIFFTYVNTSLYGELLTWGGSAYSAGTAQTICSSTYISGGLAGLVYDPTNDTFLIGNKNAVSGTLGSVWYTDGTGGGAQLGSNLTVASSGPVQLIHFEDKLFFMSVRPSHISYAPFMFEYDLSAGLAGAWSAASVEAATISVPNVASNRWRVTYRNHHATGSSEVGLAFWPSTTDLRYFRLGGKYGATRTQPTLRAVSGATQTASTGSPMTVTKPTGTVEGDLMFALVMYSDYPTVTSHTWASGGGWTKVGTTDTGNSWASGYLHEEELWFKVAGASEPASWDLVYSGSGSGATGPTVLIVTLKPAAGASFMDYPIIDTYPDTKHQYTSTNPLPIEGLAGTINPGDDVNVLTMYVNRSGSSAVGPSSNSLSYPELVDATNWFALLSATEDHAVGANSITKSVAGAEGIYANIIVDFAYTAAGVGLVVGWGWIPI